MDDEVTIMGIATTDLSSESRAALDELAGRTGRSPIEIMDEAVEAFRSQFYFDQLQAGCAALRADLEACVDFPLD
jgi:predicted transcriptional regulator